MTERLVLLIRGVTKHGKDSLLKANHASDLRVVHSNAKRGGYASFISSKSTGYSWVVTDSIHRGLTNRRLVLEALSTHKFTQFSFARKLKAQVAERYDVSLQFIEDNKDKPIIEHHLKHRVNTSIVTYRDDLIATAKYERDIDPDVYVRDVAEVIIQHKFVMITDYRNPNEYNFVRNLCTEHDIPFYTIEMIRPLEYTQGEDSPSEHYLDKSIPDIIMCSTEPLN